ncbi:5662_t:CDS:1, partial [Paraglomus occultum]
VFKESSGSVSETKKIQVEEFEFDPEKERLSNLLDKLYKEEEVVSKQSNLNKEDLKTLQEMLQESIQKKERTKYYIIDTPGIGDTKMSDNEVLDIIAEAVYLTKDGLSQVLFVVGGRFDQYEMATYNLLRTIIFDEHITEHTTITRTHFADFRSKEKRQKDI